MISISLCMIVRDEEKTLDRCLNSVKDIVDEINIIDTGSKDKTKEIARKYTDRVFDFVWCDDFAKARNFSFSKASKEYIMWLDADDVVLEKDRLKLKELKENLDNSIDMVMLKYDLNIDADGIPAVSFYRERIMKSEKKYEWISPIHEVISPNGKIDKANISITHMKIKKSDPKRNLRIFNKMIREGIELDTRQLFYYARELYYNGEYTKAIRNFKDFLNREDGWIENKISACIDLYDVYMKIGDKNKAITTLYSSFNYDIPRAEVCCYIGYYFKEQHNYTNAVYWFKEAQNKKYDLTNGGFYNKDSYDFIPYLELCVCYCYLNDFVTASYYNELAGKIKPSSEAYLNNVKYFNSLNILKNGETKLT